MNKSRQIVIVALAILLSLTASSYGHDRGSLFRLPRRAVANPAVVQGPHRVLIDCWPTTRGRQFDGDNDGIVDRCEQTLAEKFAPVVHHFEGERNYPTNVDWFLQKTQLRFYDDECDALEGGDLDEFVEDRPPQRDLPLWSWRNGCGATYTFFSNGTRSEEKERTFYLKDVADEFKQGSKDNTSEWTTYFHAYRNDRGGVTLQYWRFYAADSGKEKYLHVFGGHGGDWEGIHVVLDNCLRPVQVNLMSHTTIDALDWSSVTKDPNDPNRPMVFSEIGGHATHNFGELAVLLPIVSLRFTQQQTWTGGSVHWYDGRVTPGGVLLNIGEKMRPLNGQDFIRYSGIWGSPGFLEATSGYWNPAYNETEKGPDNFIKAWCIGRAADVPNEECYPSARIN